MRGAAANLVSDDAEKTISTHAPHARRGKKYAKIDEALKNFYSRASCEARRKPQRCLCTGVRFLLTRLMRGAAIRDYNRIKEEYISTHAPHARRGCTYRAGGCGFSISTHAPHARRGIMWTFWTHTIAISTHAPHARRGSHWFTSPIYGIHFYSRASCEARR